MLENRHSIRRRLRAMFSVAGVLLLLFGLLSIWRLTEANSASAEVRDHWLLSIRLLGDLNNFTSDLRTAEANHLLADRPERRARDEAEIQELRAGVARAMDGYEALPRDATEARMWAQFKRDWSDYRRIADEVIALSAAGRPAAAAERYLGASRTAYQAASDTLGELTDRSVEQAKAASRRDELAFQQARVYILLAICVMLFACVLVLRHMVTHVLAPMLDLAARMRSLAQNHTDIPTGGTDRQDEIGEMARAIVVFRDNAIDLAHSQRGLEQQAAMVAERLAHEQRLTDLQRNFVSMASHEFRTPLTVIDGQAQRLIRGQERGALPPEVAERARKVRLAVRRMTSLIERLMESLRLFEGDVRLYFHPAPFDLAELLAEVCQTYREIAPAARIVERLEEAPHQSLGDPGLLYQAVSNLLSNAVKYSADRPRVELRARVEGGEHVIEVSDQGIGIPPADLDHLFERFHRGSNVEGVVGTGIGLYLVKTVAELHGGSVSVQSREGGGSSFVLRYPCKEIAPA